jgi:tungstate transport system substrate-binding protein
MRSFLRLLYRLPLLPLLLLTAAPVMPGVAAPSRPIVIASTTSTEQSGLFRHLLPAFTRATGVEARVIALGTGQALDVGRRGDADVLLVHDREAEERFVAEGFAQRRDDVMYNDFVVVGPRADPAGVAGASDATEAFVRIAATRAAFVSRGDRSGTHAAELRIWQAASLEPSSVRGGWYRQTGSGMGPALNVAAGLDAYLLADRATWLAFRNRGNLQVLLEGDSRLFNQYGVMRVSPARHPHVAREPAERFVRWLLSPDGQRAIAAFRIAGEQAFFPNAAAR